MANHWTDQPKQADGDELLLLYQSGHTFQLQQVAPGNYSATVGTLFSSHTEFFDDVHDALRRINEWLLRARAGER